MTSLDEYLRERRAEIEQALESHLPAPPVWPATLVEAMRYSLMAGGKRLRLARSRCRRRAPSR